MGLAGAAVAERDDVLLALEIFTSRPFQNQHLVERWFDGSEFGLPDPPLDQPAFAVNQLQFARANEMAYLVGARRAALA